MCIGGCHNKKRISIRIKADFHHKLCVYFVITVIQSHNVATSKKKPFYSS